MELAILFGITAIGLIWFLSRSTRRRYKHLRYRRLSFPAAWKQILLQEMPYFQLLPARLQRQLQTLIQIFVAEKSFVGCHGLEVTDQMRVLIAAQACLLLLNRNTEIFPNLTEILIYPDAFIVEREVASEGNIVHSVRATVSGESWADSRVILSWVDVTQSAANPGDGFNVVVHEFAHQLDHESGAMNGAPAFTDSQQASEWAQVLSREFDHLRDQVERDHDSLLDAYGSQNPAEFFAIVSEVFFEQPGRLNTEHPFLCAELSRYYQVNPLRWFESVVDSRTEETP